MPKPSTSAPRMPSVAHSSPAKPKTPQPSSRPQKRKRSSTSSSSSEDERSTSKVRSAEVVVDIVPGGTLILDIRDETRPELRIKARVFRGVLINASPVFRVLLDGPFKEATMLKIAKGEEQEELPVVKLYEPSAIAMVVLLALLQGLTKDEEAEALKTWKARCADFREDTVMDVAVQADKYDCVSVVRKSGVYKEVEKFLREEFVKGGREKVEGYLAALWLGRSKLFFEVLERMWMEVFVEMDDEELEEWRESLGGELVEAQIADLVISLQKTSKQKINAGMRMLGEKMQPMIDDWHSETGVLLRANHASEDFRNSIGELQWRYGYNTRHPPDHQREILGKINKYLHFAIHCHGRYLDVKGYPDEPFLLTRREVDGISIEVMLKYVDQELARCDKRRRISDCIFKTVLEPAKRIPKDEFEDMRRRVQAEWDKPLHLRSARRRGRAVKTIQRVRMERRRRISLPHRVRRAMQGVVVPQFVAMTGWWADGVRRKTLGVQRWAWRRTRKVVRSFKRLRRE